MAKGLRIGNKIYPDKIICDGCRGEIDINQEEIFCSKCRNNQLAYIKKLEAQLANIKYLNADEVEKILEKMQDDARAERLGYFKRTVSAICNLAIKVDREKIIEVLKDIQKTYGKCFDLIEEEELSTIADEIIAALEGK